MGCKLINVYFLGVAWARVNPSQESPSDVKCARVLVVICVFYRRRGSLQVVKIIANDDGRLREHSLKVLRAFLPPACDQRVRVLPMQVIFAAHFV